MDPPNEFLIYNIYYIIMSVKIIAIIVIIEILFRASSNAFN